MSQYYVKKKGWRYNFQINKKRYTGGFYETKNEAKREEFLRREELNNPDGNRKDISFLELTNLRLDKLERKQTKKYYKENVYMAKKWYREWGETPCSQITTEMIEDYLDRRSEKSASSANYEKTCLKTTFNFGIKKKLCKYDPVVGIEDYDYEKKEKFIPTPKQIDKVIKKAKPEQKDYLTVLRFTLARMSEVNKLQWKDVDFKNCCLTLYSKKKKGGKRTPRKIYMVEELLEVLKRRYKQRYPEMPWVFWHRYWSKKHKCFIKGRYKDRKHFMRTVCDKAKVKYFRFHSLRHSGASVLASDKETSLPEIQAVLGHDRATTTDTYIKEITGSTKKTMNKLKKMTHKLAHQEENDEQET